MKKYTLEVCDYGRIKVFEDGKMLRYIPGGLEAAVAKMKIMIPEIEEVEVVNQGGSKEIKKL